jgi:hypothetical protein
LGAAPTHLGTPWGGKVSLAMFALVFAVFALFATTQATERSPGAPGVLHWSYEQMKPILFNDHRREWQEGFGSYEDGAEGTMDLNSTLLEVMSLARAYRHSGRGSDEIERDTTFQRRSAMIKLAKRLEALLEEPKDPIKNLHKLADSLNPVQVKTRRKAPHTRHHDTEHSTRTLGVIKETSAMLSRSLQAALRDSSNAEGSDFSSFLELASSPTMSVHRVTESQLVAESAQQLETMLMEVHTATSSLLAAGIQSREIFACVVDQIMNMAPEMILQLIINSVRTAIVNLLASLMSASLPSILIPNMGQVPITMTPIGQQSLPGPVGPPCVCKAGDGSMYDPVTGISGGDPDNPTTDSDKDPSLRFLTVGELWKARVDSFHESKEGEGDPQFTQAYSLVSELDGLLSLKQVDSPSLFVESSVSSSSPTTRGGMQLWQGGYISQTELVPECPCRAGHLGFRYYPSSEGSNNDNDQDGMRFSSSRSESKGTAQSHVQIMAMAEQRQGAAADAFSASSSWVFHSQFQGVEGAVRASTDTAATATAGGAGDKGKTGPIGKMEPKLREEIDAGMRGTALPRVYTLAAQALHERLSKEIPLAVHQLTSRLAIGPMARRFTLTLYRRLMAKLAKPLVVSVSRRLHEDMSRELARPLALSITHALAHDPKEDVYCALCLKSAEAAALAKGTSPDGAITLPVTLNDTLLALESFDQGSPSQDYLTGPYCQSCRLARRRARLLSKRVSQLIGAEGGSTDAIISEVAKNIPTYARDTMGALETFYSTLPEGKKGK